MFSLWRSRTASLAQRQLDWSRWLPLWCALIALLLVPYPALQRDLWTDEAFTASYTGYATIGQVLNDVRKNEETPPLSFLLTWVWANMFGNSELALRLVSLISGVLAIGLFVWFAQQNLPRWQAANAGVLLTIAPLVTSFMIEARSYAPTMLLSVICLIAFENVYHNPLRLKAYFHYAVVATTLFLTSYFSVSLLLAHNLIWLIALLRSSEQRSRRMLLWATTQVAVFAMIALWVPTMFYQMIVSKATTSSAAAGLRSFYVLDMSMLLHVPPNNAWRWLWLPLAVLIWLLSKVALGYSRRHDQGLVLRTFGAPLLMLAGLVAWMGVVAPRYLVVLLPGAALAVAQGSLALNRLRPRLGFYLIIALQAGLLTYQLAGAALPRPVKPWTALTHTVALEANPETDVVLFHPPWDQRIFEYYYDGPELPLLGAHDYDTFYYKDRTHDLDTTWTSRQALAATQSYRRVWVFYDQMFHTVPRLSLPYWQLGHWKSDRLELFLYEVPDEID